MMSTSVWRFEHTLAQREEGLRGGIGIEHAIVVAEHQDRMRQRAQQQIVLDVAARCGAGALADELGLHAAISWARR